MLGVTTVASGSALDAGVSEEVDEAVVITSGEELTVSGAADRVDVSTVSAGGVDTGGLPLELASLASPCGTLGVAATRRILFAVGDGVEEELVGTAVRADVVGLSAPVKSHNVGLVGGHGTLAVPAGGAVDSDLVVVRSDSEPLVVGGEGHNLDPLLAFLQKMDLLVGGGAGADGDLTVVTGNSEPVVVDSNSTRALGVGQVGES